MSRCPAIIDGERVCEAIAAISPPEAVQARARTFAVLGDLTRLTLLTCIKAAGPISVSDLAAATGLNGTTVSQTLRYLRAARQQELAASYHALHEAYRQRETVFATVMADRGDWEIATRAQRHLAVAADIELCRRHPGQPFPPLRSAEPEPEPGTDTRRDDLTVTRGEPPGEMPTWIKDLAAAHRTFAATLADRQSLRIPSQDPHHGDLGPAFPPWPASGKDAILQPPKPEITPSPQVLQRATDRVADWEAAD